MKVVLATLAAVLLLLTAGCGSSRPSESDVSGALREGKDLLGQKVTFSKTEADCIAKVLVKSKLSDDALNAIVAGEDYEASADDKKIAASLSGTEDCIERPTVAQVSKAFQAGVASSQNTESVLKLPKAQADCVAKVLVDQSKISDSDLYQVVSQKVLDTGDANAAAVQAVQKNLTACEKAK